MKINSNVIFNNILINKKVTKNEINEKEAVREHNSLKTTYPKNYYISFGVKHPKKSKEYNNSQDAEINSELRQLLLPCVRMMHDKMNFDTTPLDADAINLLISKLSRKEKEEIVIQATKQKIGLMKDYSNGVTNTLVTRISQLRKDSEYKNLMSAYLMAKGVSLLEHDGVVDAEKIKELYEEYKKPLTETEKTQIIDYFNDLLGDEIFSQNRKKIKNYFSKKGRYALKVMDKDFYIRKYVTKALFAIFDKEYDADLSDIVARNMELQRNNSFLADSIEDYNWIGVANTLWTI